MNKKLFIRCDFSEQIGLGHLKRMLILAKSFNQLKYQIKIFYKKNTFSFDFVDLGFSVCSNNIVLEEEFIDSLIIEKPEICILDLHSKDKYIEILNKINKSVKNIKLICFEYSADIEKYSDLCIVPFPFIANSSKKVLSGLNYQMFSEDLYYFKNKMKIKKKDDVVLISFGGSDPNNYSFIVLKTLIELKFKHEYFVILGPFFKNKNKRMVKILAKNYPNISIIDKPSKLGEYYFISDYVISSGGQSKFEVALFKKPNYIIPNNVLEKKYSKIFSRINGLSYVQNENKITTFNLRKGFKNFINKYSKKNYEFHRLKSLFDGNEVSRIVKNIVK